MTPSATSVVGRSPTALERLPRRSPRPVPVLLDAVVLDAVVLDAVVLDVVLLDAVVTDAGSEAALDVRAVSCR